MKKAKRIISSLVACAMIASTIAAMSANVYAVSTDELTATVGSVTAEAGGTFSIDVSLANVPSTGIQGLEFAIKYDPSLITIDSVEEGIIATSTGAAAAELGIAPDLAGTNVNGGDYSCLDYDIAADAGTVSVMWVTGMTEGSYWISEDGVLLTLNGTVDADAEGELDIEIVPIARETYPDSGVSNSNILFGYLDSETAKTVTYNATTVNGGVTVSADTTDTSVTTTTSDDVEFILGDINEDGKVSSADLVLLSRALVFSATLTDTQSLAADVTKDGEVKTNDLVLLSQVLVGTATL